MKIKRRQNSRSDLRMTPLIDVVLLLLIFFLLTSSFVTPSSISVDLPESQNPKTGRETPVKITITSDGTILLDGEETTLKELKRKIPDLKEKKISIRGDRESSLGTFLNVWDVLKSSGVDIFQVRVKSKSK